MVGLQEGRLGGHPAATAFCEPCGKGIAVAAWQDDADQFSPMQIRTARYETDSLDTTHRLSVIGDCLVAVPALIELGSTFSYVQQQTVSFLTAWLELHNDCST